MELLENIYNSLDAGDLGTANKLAMELYDNEEKRNTAIELLVSIAIEAGDVNLALKRAEELDGIPATPYRNFLRARAMFLAKKIGRAFGYLHDMAKSEQLKNETSEIQEKIYNLLGQCYRFLGYPSKAAEAYYKAYAVVESPKLKILEYSNYLFNLHYLNISKVDYFRVHKEYNELFHDTKIFSHRKSLKNKLRIGYISPDFRNHVVLRFTYAMLTAYNKEHFEVYCYSTGHEDEYSRALCEKVDAWRSLQGQNAENIAQRIYDDSIDILVELSGHCGGGNLPVLAYKPAPIQICGIGYFATTGLKTVDYFLTDEMLGSEGEYFTEKLLKLKHSHFCYTPLYQVAESKDAPCKKNNYVTFGSFNNLTKVTDSVLDAWSKILNEVPTAKLLLKGALFDDEVGKELFNTRLENCGIALERVELRGISKEYLNEYFDMDIALDTFPYPGGGTTCDALYMGVPVISLLDGTHGGNFGGSILTNMGLEVCCVNSIEEYIQRAVELANDYDLINDMHRGLRSIMKQSPVMDSSLYMKELEDAYTRIWEDYNKVVITSRELTQYFQQMKQYWALGNVQETLKLAEQILGVNPSSNRILGALLEIFIDTNEVEKSEYVSKLLLNREKLSGYEYFLLGKSCEINKKYYDCIKYGKRALDDDSVLGDSLAQVYDMLGLVYRRLAMSKESAECHKKAALYAESMEVKAAAYSNYLFTLHLLDIPGEVMCQEARAYRSLFEDIQPYSHDYVQYESMLPPDNKIRIGYLSSDLKQHVVAEFVQSFFRCYDKSMYEVYVYANCRENNFAKQFEDMVDSWQYVYQLTHEEIAKLIHANGIHILVELGGHTADNNLPVLAYRPAPVQICGIGYFGSTGLDCVDYFLGDKYLDADESAADFQEKFLRLENSHWCYRPMDLVNTGVAEFGCPYVGDPCKTSVAPITENGYVTYGSFNEFHKLSSELLSTWKQILDQVPDSMLYLKGSVYSNADQRQRLSAMCMEVGLSLDRIILEDRSVNYMQDYSNIDIALDPFPYGGGGTTCDALYMGVPVVTLCGTRHHSRFGYSVMMNIGGMEDCCATSKEEYVDKAVALAKNKARIKYLHKAIRRKMELCPLMDENLYIADLEAAYYSAWQRYLHCQMRIDVGLFSVMGHKYLRRRDYSRGLYWIKKAIECQGPNMVELYGYLAQTAINRVDHYQAWYYIMKACEQLKNEEYQGTNSFRTALYNNRANFAKAIGKVDEALEYYYKTVELAESVGERSHAYGNYLYTLLCTEASWQTISGAHREYNNLYVQWRKDTKSLIEKRIRSFAARRHDKIHVGYMSPDFRQHVMFSFYYVLLSSYDKTRFKVTCYQLSGKSDGFTEHLKSMVDIWEDVSQVSIDELGNKIYSDEVDILVDLAGHTAYSGLPVFVYRPAPVQITGLGWMETTGLQETDYFITDRYVDPEGDNYLIEKPMYLNSQFCYVARNDLPVPQEAPCITQGYITFGVFNNWYKVNDNILGLWQRIMDLVPTAHLLIKCQLFISLSAQELAFERMYKLGFDMDRVLFEPATDNYMNRYLSVDIALDTCPYPGGGTTCDSLYMGVPVVSLYGKRRGSRFGYSILENIGLGELATDNPDEYVMRAVALAQDRDLLSYLHKNIRNMLKNSPVMNTRLYIKELQERYCEVLNDVIRRY